MSNLKFTASETEIIKPFETKDNVFDHCEIMYSEKIGYDSTTNIIADSADVDTFKLKFDLPVNQIENFFNQSANELKISTIFRDQYARFYTKVHEASLDEINQKEIDLFELVPQNINLGRFSASLILTTNSTDKSRSTYDKLAQKTFKFTLNNQKINFERIWKAPEDFEAEKLSKKTVWYLKWIGEDLDKPINELVILWLNSALKLQIQRACFSDNNELFKKQMAASILLDVMYPILKKGIDQNETETIAFQTIFSQISKRFGVDLDELTTLSSRPNFHSILSSWCSILVGLDSSIEVNNEK